MKTTIQILLIISIPVAMLFFIVMGPSLIHSHRLNNFADNLYEYPLPPDTKICSQHKEAGPFMSNGDYLTYRASMTLFSRLTKDEIIKYYKNVKLPSARPNVTSPVTLQIKFIQVLDKNIIFEIRIIDGEYEPIGFDLRCS